MLSPHGPDFARCGLRPSRLLQRRLCVVDPPVVVFAATVADEDAIVAHRRPGDLEAVRNARVGHAIQCLAEVALQVPDDRLTLVAVELGTGLEDEVVYFGVARAVALAGHVM